MNVAEQAWADAVRKIPSGPRSPFTSITFTLTHDQAARVRDALTRVKAVGPFSETGNRNSNGNALARIVEVYEFSQRDQARTDRVEARE